MSDNPELNLVEDALAMGEDFDWFDDSFLVTMQKHIKSGHQLTEKQLIAVNNIHNMLMSREDR